MSEGRTVLSVQGPCPQPLPRKSVHRRLAREAGGRGWWWVLVEAPSAVGSLWARPDLLRGPQRITHPL